MTKLRMFLLASTARPAHAAALAAAMLLPASIAQAQTRTKPAPLSMQASETNTLLPQLSLPSTSTTTTYSLAPMPNSDLNAPLPPTPKSAEVSPSLFQPRKQFRGDGYSYGTTSQGYVEQHLKPAPGISLKVPLE